MLTEKRVKRNSLPPSFHLALPRSAGKDLLIKAGICRVTALLLLAQASEVLSEHSSFPIHTKCE